MNATDDEARSSAQITVDRGSGEVEIVDDDGRWTLREYEEAGQICVELRVGLGGGSNCTTDDEGPFGLLGASNSTFAPRAVPDERGADLPEELLAAASEFAYAYGRVPTAVTHVRATTNLGDRFVVATLGGEGAPARYFVVTIPAEKAPLEMQVEQVEFTEDADARGDDAEWIEQLDYLMLETFSAPVDLACVKEMATFYNGIPIDDLEVDPEPTPEAVSTFLERIEVAVGSDGASFDEPCDGSLGPEGRQELLRLLEPRVAELLQAGAEAAVEELRAGD